MLPGHVAVVQRLAEALVKLVALQPIQFYCLHAGEYVHAARDHAVDRREANKKPTTDADSRKLGRNPT